MEWGRLSNKQESDHEPLCKPVKEFQEIPLKAMRKMNQMDQDKKIH